MIHTLIFSTLAKFSKWVLPLTWVLSFAKGQTNILRYDFNTSDLKLSTLGVNAVSCDPDAMTTGSAYIMNVNCGADKGLDLDVPNTGAILDRNLLGMTFRFQRDESLADFFTRGGTKFYISGGTLYIQYRTSDGAGGYVDYGPTNTGQTVVNDDNFHDYTFEYVDVNGLAKVLIDGATVWSNDGPNNRPLYWTGAGNAMIATVMDGNCMGRGVLDYANLYLPNPPLALEFIDFSAKRTDPGVLLRWEVANASEEDEFFIEKKYADGEFTTITQMVPSSQSSGYYEFTDLEAGDNQVFYRIRSVEMDGKISFSEVSEVALSQNTQFRIWPNPAKDILKVVVGGEGAEMNIEIYSIEGTKVKETTGTTGGENYIDISDLSSGTWIVSVSTAKNIFRKKIMVE